MACLDALNRPIEYLRISVTDRCNLRCIYCMPPGGIPWRPHDEILRYEEIVQVVRVAAEMGVRKVRLTGGEPLVRQGLAGLIASLAAVPGVEDLSMTTNGILLEPRAEELVSAGLRRVNISLDSLDPERFSRLTRGGDLTAVLRGVEAARRAGLNPVKLNTVVIRHWNDSEVTLFARMTREEGWNVRFIELMPVGRWQDEGRETWQERLVTVEEIRRRIEETLGPLWPYAGPDGVGPARYYRLEGAEGTIGFISPVSEHFCARCNRLRLSADGRLRPCLLSDTEVDLRTILRNEAGPEEVRERIIEAIRRKPAGHRLAKGEFPLGRAMSEIGG